MKLKSLALESIATLAIVISANFICASSFAQNDPLNSWTLRWNGSGNPVMDSVNSIAYGNGMFVAAGDGARLVSYDGVNWTTYVSPPIINGTYSYTNGGWITYAPTPTPPGIIYSAGTFLAFGTSIPDKANYILKSTNGLAWTPIYTTSNGIFNAVFAAAYGNNTWVFLATNQIITASITSSNWNWTQFQPDFSPSAIVYGNGTFAIAAVNPNSVWSSSDGITWQYHSTVPMGHRLVYGNGVFVTAYGNTVGVSSDLTGWTYTNVSDTGADIVNNELAFGGGQFIATIGYDVWTSSNAIDWIDRFSTSPMPSAFAYGQGTFIIGGDDGEEIYQSGLFVSNSPATTLTISTYLGITINGTEGALYQIQCATNLNSTWLPLTNVSLPYSPFIWVDTSSTLGGQRFYRSIQVQ